jgi:hypothetical protein
MAVEQAVRVFDVGMPDAVDAGAQVRRIVRKTPTAALSA